MSEELDFRSIAKAAPLMRALSSVLVSRANFSGLHGLSFNGNRDLYEALGYTRVISPAQYRARYERNGVAARVVEVKPQSTWRGGGEVVEVEDAQKTTAFEKAWVNLDNRLKVWNTLERADILAGLGRFSIVLIGAPGKNLETPVTQVTTDQIWYISPFGEDEVTVDEWEDNIEDPRFGQARFYKITRILKTNIQTNRSVGLTGQRVHWSRCLHIADGLLNDSTFGTPRLERVWNLLDDLEKVTGGGAEAYWKRADRGLQFDLNKDMEVPDEEKQKMKDQIDEFTNDLKRILTTRGVKINEMGSDVADIKGPADAIVDQICAAIGIPQRILIGSEAGHLASTQDQENWAQRIRDRRRQFAEPLILRPFIDRLIEWGALPKPKEYSVRWLELDSLGDFDRVKIGVQVSTINKNMGQEVIEPDEIRDRYLGLPKRTKPIKKLPSATPAVKPGVKPPGAGQPSATEPVAASEILELVGES